jgi:hypothetical protein
MDEALCRKKQRSHPMNMGCERAFTRFGDAQMHVIDQNSNATFYFLGSINVRFEFKNLSAVAVGISVLSLAACGGGGGGGTSSSTPSNGAISGVASKGLMVGAKVTAYCGVSPTTPIGTATTDTNGSYALTLTQACATPIEVVVSAVSGTTMLDETSPTPVTLPAGFAMRAFVPASSGGTISQPITPLTDMAAALVETAVAANTPLSPAVVGNANSAIISTVLGGNAALFSAVPLAPSHYADSSTTSEQKQLITLLSSISAAAQSQAGATAGDKIKAVLDQLVAQAKSTIPAVTATTYAVSPAASTVAASGTAGATPLATIQSGLAAISAGTAVVQGGAAIADAVKTNVALFQTAVVDSAASQVTQGVASGTVTPPTTAGATLSAAIASAKLLFASLRANVLSLVDPATPTWLQTRLTDVQSDFNGLNLAGTYNPVDLVKAAQRATALLVEVNRALANATTPVNATSGSDAFGAFYQRRFSDGAGNDWNCNVYYTSTGTVNVVDGSTRNSPIVGNNGNPVATCNHFIHDDGVSQLQFIVRSPAAPASVASGANFAYTNRIRKWNNPLCTGGANAQCTFIPITDTVDGTLTATWDSAAVLKTMAIAANSSGGNVISYRTPGSPASLALAYTISSAAGVDTIGFTGSLTDGNLSYGFQPGTTIATTPSTTPGNTTAAVSTTLVGRIQTGAFQYNGTFGASGNSGSGTANTGSLAGSIATVSGSTVTPFLEGTLSGNATNKTIAFSAKITNGVNVNNVSGTGNAAVAGQQDLSLTYTFPGYSISFSGRSFDDVTRASTGTLSASDGTTIAVTRSNGSSALVVRNAAGTSIGSLTGNTVNFDDGSTITLN